MFKGFIINNTGRSRHIFQRTVYPGGKVDVADVYKLLAPKVPEGFKFEDWIKTLLPKGWEVDIERDTLPNVVEVSNTDVTGGRAYKEVLTALPVVSPTVVPIEEQATKNDVVAMTETEVDDSPSKEFLTPRHINRMSAKDIYNLRIKDNPKRILKNVTSIHKLRRALTLCKNDSRKEVLRRLVQGRIRELNVTL